MAWRRAREIGRETTLAWLRDRLRAMDWVSRHEELRRLCRTHAFWGWLLIFSMGPDEILDGCEECEFPEDDQPIPLPDRVRRPVQQRLQF